MATVHRATLTPTKTELIAAWLPAQGWFAESVEDVTPVGAYRFDDPAGEVGIESHVLDTDGRTVHVPLTYRGAPLEGAEEYLLGTTEHSVLGTRWVYDAVGDPVYRAVVADVIAHGGTQADVWLDTPEGPVRREPTTQVRGSGSPAPASARLVVVREPDAAAGVPSDWTLTGTWPGQGEAAVLVYLA